MAKNEQHPTIRVKEFKNEFKCSGCNYMFTAAWYFSNERVPRYDKSEPGHRLTHGLCATCFMEMLCDNGVRVLWPSVNIPTETGLPAAIKQALRVLATYDREGDGMPNDHVSDNDVCVSDAQAILQRGLRERKRK